MSSHGHKSPGEKLFNRHSANFDGLGETDYREGQGGVACPHSPLCLCPGRRRSVGWGWCPGALDGDSEQCRPEHGPQGRLGGEEQCPRGRLRKDGEQRLRVPTTSQEVTRKADTYVTGHRGSQEREAGERRQKAQWGQGAERKAILHGDFWNQSDLTRPDPGSTHELVRGAAHGDRTLGHCQGS